LSTIPFKQKCRHHYIHTLLHRQNKRACGQWEIFSIPIPQFAIVINACQWIYGSKKPSPQFAVRALFILVAAA